MSNQTEHEKQQTMIPEEVRQPLQAELDASEQAIEALSDKQLEAITGGAGPENYTAWEGVKLKYGLNRDQNKGILQSVFSAVKEGPALGDQIHKVTGINDSEQMKEWMKQKNVSSPSGSSKKP